ncbi:MAG: hypothetical protein RI977_478, partial [Bacteroidota bacterium]
IVVGTGQKFKASQIGLYRCVYNENGCQSDSSAIGSKVLEMDLLEGQTTTVLDIKGWQSGLYYLKYLNAEGRSLDNQVLVVE